MASAELAERGRLSLERARARKLAPASWHEVPAAAIRLLPRSPVAHQVAVTVAQRGEGRIGGYAQIGAAEVAEKVGITERSAQRCLAALTR